MILLYFKATWCSVCRTMRPIIEQLQKEGYDIQVVDTDKDKNLPKKYNIDSLPTSVMIQDGQEVDRFVGRVSADELRKRLTKKAPDYKIW
jgi:thioredoxin-like negative regulator of GroEL